MSNLATALVIKAPGTNCDVENSDALRRAGASVEVATTGELLASPEMILRKRILCLPGGFAHGDDVASARILANQCRLRLGDTLQRFVDQEGGFVLGICNGFQALVKTGLLPRTAGGLRQECSVVHNDSGHYECRWVRLRIESSACAWLPQGDVWEMPVGHGEGKFVPGPNFDAEASNLVAFRYVDADDSPTTDYPANPNGSLAAIAGLTSPDGRVIGLMPHPDRSYLPYHHPDWGRRELEGDEMAGAKLFRALVAAASG
ncbi:MAG: phosphoribosylformylglycinamidine synthase [Planctomycetes bacterium]|jgi:phosphoribosylformylglycinamidine synthase|nr:phosphoribosylformylglycinamidine synthase [Planctomycetota bacterium]MDP6423938.1 phosphoribosylformylglycinamidine synthase subunit PurQ [Planctomycetota bacterium]